MQWAAYLISAPWIISSLHSAGLLSQAPSQSTWQPWPLCTTREVSATLPFTTLCCSWPSEASSVHIEPQHQPPIGPSPPACILTSWQRCDGPTPSTAGTSTCWQPRSLSPSLAFRISEFIAPSPRIFDPRHQATQAELRQAPTRFIFQLSHSKTDQFLGATPCAFLGGRPTLPLCYNDTLYFPAPPNLSPSFTIASGHPLMGWSCPFYLRHLLHKAHYPASEINSHNFRIGAATTSTQVGVSAKTVKCLGRWRNAMSKLLSRSCDEI